MKLLDKDGYGPWALVTGAASGIGEKFARQVTTITRADMTAAFEGMKGAVAEMTKARLAAAQPAH